MNKELIETAIYYCTELLYEWDWNKGTEEYDELQEFIEQLSFEIGVKEKK